MKIYVNQTLKRQIDHISSNKALARCCLWLCSQLYTKAADESDDVSNFSGYFPLQSTTIRTIVTSRFYSDMWRILRELKAIEVKGQTANRHRGTYVSSALAAKIGAGVSPTSKQYRLAAKFRTGVVPVTIDADALATRIEKQFTRSSYVGMKGSARSWVITSYKSARFSAGAAKILANHPFKSPDARNRAENHVANLMAHRLRFQPHVKTGRIYYTVANLPKALRKEILLDGEKTVELDIAASQPTLLAALYGSDCPERHAYLAEVQSGNFYEQIAVRAGKRWDRDRSKTEFFNQIAFGSYYNEAKYELLPAFRRRFPILESIMSDIKRGGNDKLPLLMQSCEARIVVDKACGECAIRKVKVLPVHDSLIVKASEAEVAREILARHWMNETKIPARIKGGGRVAARATPNRFPSSKKKTSDFASRLRKRAQNGVKGKETAANRSRRTEFPRRRSPAWKRKWRCWSATTGSIRITSGKTLSTSTRPSAT